MEHIQRLIKSEREIRNRNHSKSEVFKIFKELLEITPENKRSIIKRWVNVISRVHKNCC